MKIKGIVTTTVLTLALIIISTTTAAALFCGCGDICVNETGWWRDGGAFTTSTTPTQAAIDNAGSGETICVAAGSYTENVDIATAHLTLRGEGAGMVTVTAASSSDHVFDVTADYVNISGFTATGAAGWPNAGIYLNGADNCNISENNCSNNWCGIYLYLSSNSNMLANNTANSNNRYGILLSSSSNNTLLNNTAYNNINGIYLSSSNSNTLESNNASNNDYGICLDYLSNDNMLTGNTASSNNDRGILLDVSSNNTFESNNASNNDYGICLYSLCNDNMFTGNTVDSNSVVGIYLSSSSNNLVYNNYFNNTKNAYDRDINQWNITKTNGTNIIGGPFLGGNYWNDYTGADNDGDGLGDTGLLYNSAGGIQNGGDFHPLTASASATPCNCGDICVNQSGWWRDGGAFIANTTPIQAAVDNAGCGEMICVAAGSYTENVDIMKQIKLTGEGADVVTVTAANPGDHVFEMTADYVSISGFTATGTTDYPYAGIYLGGADHCSISENNASNNFCGIRLSHSSNNTIASNNCSNSIYGIWLWPLSNYNTLANNTANSNSAYGIYLSSLNNNTLTSNTANSNGNGILLAYSSNNTMSDNSADSNSDYGIRLSSSSNNTLVNNTVDSNNDYGIQLYYSSSNMLASNNASNNDYGIWLDSSSGNRLANNTADSNNRHGIRLYKSSNNTLVSNNASNSNGGILLEYSSDNTLMSNNVSSNYYGICLSSSSNYNLIYNNYFKNTKNAYDYSNNQWNITKTSGTNIIGGPFLGGNYWSDYTGADNEGDGLGDTLTPYDSFGNIQNGGDIHPLTAPPATPPTVTVIRPDGGEEIPGDSVYDITWSVTAGTYNLAAYPVNISYSADSGTSWDSIASNEPDDGRYSWSVPNIDSSECLVSVTARDVNGNTGSDVSDSTFTILPTDNSTNETIPEGETETVEGPPESNTTVNVTAEGNVTVTIAYYNETPHPGATEPDGMVPKYIDIAFSDNDNVSWLIYVEMHYTDDEILGLDESSLGLYYYNESGEWLRCSDTDVNVDENYIWANVTADECPGSPFGAGGSTDNTPPVILITMPEPDGIYTVGMELDFSTTDDESGVATIAGNLTNTSGVSQIVDSDFAPDVGVYTLVVTATDNASNTNVSDPVFFVVYDPAGGRATGEGWFDPGGESTLHKVSFDPNGESTIHKAGFDPDGEITLLRADFEFIAWYKNDVSTGNLDFEDRDADIKLNSTSFDWLVISGMSAQFQGTGTINGEDLYTFRVLAKDLYNFREQAKDNGMPGINYFDIKIWNGTDMADLYYEANNNIAYGDIKVSTK